MKTSLDEQIRRALKKIIKPLVPTAVVTHIWLPGHDERWIDQLRSASDENRVHAWCMMREDEAFDWDTGLAEPDRRVGQMVYRIFGYRQHALGIEADNVQDKFYYDCERIQTKLAKTQDLGIPDIVAKHQGVNFGVDLYQTGSVLFWGARGTLVVEIDRDLED